VLGLNETSSIGSVSWLIGCVVMGYNAGQRSILRVSEAVQDAYLRRNSEMNPSQLLWRAVREK